MAELLLERYGIVTREQVLAESIPGGFSSAVRRAVDAWRRSASAGAATSSRASAAPSSRCPARSSGCARCATREEAAAGRARRHRPAQPYGAALPWPKRDGETSSRARRVRGAYVVLAGAEPVVFVEKGGRGLQLLTEHADDPRVRPALEALAAFVTEGRAGRGTKLSLEKVDGEPVVGSPVEELLIELGFRPGPRKLTLSA